MIGGPAPRGEGSPVPPRSRNPAALLRAGLLALPLLACSGAAPEPAPEEPSATDIVVVEVDTLGGLVAFGEPVRVTERDGYDNQPAFTADGGALLFSSRHGSQVDVWRYAIDERDLDRLTLTLESEYSAQPLPGGRGFSAVRVEQDGRQRLWAFDPESDDAPRLLLPAPDWVGYYAWGADGTLALHVLGQQPTLQLVRAGAPPRTVRTDVGRSLQAVPGRLAFSFSAAGPDGAPWIHLLELDGEAVRPLVPALAGSLDHAWLPDGTLVMARDATVWARRPDADDDWSVWLDLAEHGLDGITRIAVSPAGDRVALVVRE